MEYWIYLLSVVCVVLVYFKSDIIVKTIHKVMDSGKVIISEGAKNDDRFSQINYVDIDSGRFKYVLIRVYDGDNFKYIVRGYGWAGYHADVFDHVTPSIEDLGLKTSCEGGGRIVHKPGSDSLEVYGYSMGFGKADHALSCAVLKEKYPNYKITWSDEGY